MFSLFVHQLNITYNAVIDISMQVFVCAYDFISLKWICRNEIALLIEAYV